MTKNKFFLSIFLLFNCSLALTQNNIKAVEILSHTGDDNYQIGTGFLLSKDGIIYTCYHVIENAKDIEIHYFDDNGRILKSSKILIKGINVNYDLAKLYCSDIVGIGDSIDVENNIVSLGDADIWCFPRDYDKLKITGKIIADHFSNSLNYTKNSEDIFNTKIDLVILDITVQPGMSGGALVENGKVVGVFDGGIDNGRTIAWAIPIKYLNNIIPSTGTSSIQNITTSKLLLINDDFQSELKSYIKIPIDVKVTIDSMYSETEKFLAEKLTLPIVNAQADSFKSSNQKFISYLNISKINSIVNDSLLDSYSTKVGGDFSDWNSSVSKIVKESRKLINYDAKILDNKVVKFDASAHNSSFIDSLNKFQSKILVIENFTEKFLAYIQPLDSLLRDFKSTHSAYLLSPTNANKISYLNSLINFFKWSNDYVDLFNESDLIALIDFPKTSLVTVLKLFN